MVVWLQMALQEQLKASMQPKIDQLRAEQRVTFACSCTVLLRQGVVLTRLISIDTRLIDTGVDGGVGAV